MIRQLFDLHRPRFVHIDCLDLVLDDKLLLLLSWDTVHAYKLRIRPGAHVYRAPSGAVVCGLPNETGSVTIILYSFWRSTKISFHLKRIAVNDETMRYLDDHFLKGFSFSITRIQSCVAEPKIKIQKLLLEIQVKPEDPAICLSINHLQLNDYAP